MGKFYGFWVTFYITVALKRWASVEGELVLLVTLTRHGSRVSPSQHLVQFCRVWHFSGTNYLKLERDQDRPHRSYSVSVLLLLLHVYVLLCHTRYLVTGTWYLVRCHCATLLWCCGAVVLQCCSAVFQPGVCTGVSTL